MKTTNIPKIEIAGWQEANALLSSKAFDHVVSINDPEEDPPPALMAYRGHTLVLHFRDLDDSRGGPSEDAVQKIIAFARQIGPGESVLCQCGMGVSRSPAAALIIFAATVRTRDPATAMLVCSWVHTVKRDVLPNARMVAIADKTCGWGGNLDSARRIFFGDRVSFA